MTWKELPAENASSRTRQTSRNLMNYELPQTAISAATDDGSCGMLLKSGPFGRLSPPTRGLGSVISSAGPKPLFFAKSALQFLGNSWLRS